MAVTKAVAKKSQKEIKTPEVQVAKITKEFTFKLNDKEVADRGRAAGKLRREINALVAELEEIKAERTAAIKAKAAERDHHLSVIDDGKENRLVEVEMRKNFEAKLIQYYFKGALLEERAMSPEEMQMALPLKAKKKAKEKEPTGAQKTYAKAKGTAHASSNGKAKENDVAATIREETSRKTKRSAVDGIYGTA